VLAESGLVTGLTSEGIQRKETARVMDFADAALNQNEIEEKYRDMEVL
jgi:hypothetical protein